MLIRTLGGNEASSLTPIESIYSLACTMGAFPEEILPDNIAKALFQLVQAAFGTAQ